MSLSLTIILYIFRLAKSSDLSGLDISKFRASSKFPRVIISAFFAISVEKPISTICAKLWSSTGGCVGGHSLGVGLEEKKLKI